VDGELNPETKEMLEEFQEKHDLQVTGEADDQTRAKLLEEHGC
jgi:peptidoglycan hydrolase-like protein with peptidoglycan-binding domain